MSYLLHFLSVVMITNIKFILAGISSCHLMINLQVKELLTTHDSLLAAIYLVNDKNIIERWWMIVYRLEASIFTPRCLHLYLSF